MSTITGCAPWLAAFPFIRIPMPARLARPSELRIDVDLDPSGVERDLDALYQRLLRPGDALHGLPVLCIRFPGFVFRYREADGEHYVYVEDVVHRRLAGCIVFNRLVELSRRADPWLRAPHTRIAPAYQRSGIATAVYRWWLDAGNVLISGVRQSAGANALWRSLGRHYPVRYVRLREKRLHCLGRNVDASTVEDFHTRIILLGKGRDDAFLRDCVGMLPSCNAGEGEHGDGYGGKSGGGVGDGVGDGVGGLSGAASAGEARDRYAQPALPALRRRRR